MINGSLWEPYQDLLWDLYRAELAIRICHRTGIPIALLIQSLDLFARLILFGQLIRSRRRPYTLRNPSAPVDTLQAGYPRRRAQSNPLFAD